MDQALFSPNRVNGINSEYISINQRELLSHETDYRDGGVLVG